MSKRTKDYLGDSVYADFDGRVTLTTENGFGPSNTIVLEPEVIEALFRYIERMFKIRIRTSKQEEEADE